MSSKIKIKKDGFALLTAIVTTSILLLVSFVVVNIAVKQLVLANSSQESQYAFYNADSGVECAMYWDLKNPSLVSAFDPSVASPISCNGQNFNVGGALSSSFTLNLPKGYVIVTVTKGVDTTIESKGYNSSSGRKFERGIRVTY